MSRMIGVPRRGLPPMLTVLAFMALGLSSTDAVAAFPGVDGGQSLLPACEATLDPSEVSTADSPATVTATFSEEVGEVRDVSVDEESGIEVLSVQGSSPNEVTVTLVTRNGAEGEWAVTFRGDTGECAGQLTVTSTR